MKRLLILFSIIFALAFTSVQNVAAANPDEPLVGCHTWDFTEDDGTWEVWTRDSARPDLGTYVSGQGWRTENFSTNGREVNIRYEFASPQVITYFSYKYSVTYNGQTSFTSYGILLDGPGPINTNPGDVVTYVANRGIIGNGIEEAEGAVPNLTASYIALLASFATGNPLTFIEATVCGTPEEEEELIKPLTFADEHAWALEEVDETSAVMGFGVSPDLPVHVAASGTVTSISNLSLPDCGDLLDWDFSFLEQLPAFLQPSVDCLAIHDLDGVFGDYYTIGSAYAYSPIEFEGANVPDVWRVAVQLDDGRILLYFVDQADRYLTTVGQRVQAGCVLGTTATMRGFLFGLNPFTAIQRPFSDKGITVVGMRTPVTTDDGTTLVPVELHDLLTEYPTSDTPCNNPYDGCLGDTLMQLPEEWTTSGNVVFGDSSVLIAAGASLYTQMNLDNSVNVTVRVIAARSIPIGQATIGVPIMRLRVGNDTDDFEILSYDFEEYVFDLGTGATPDAGEFYTVGIENAGAGTLRVKTICVLNYDGTEPEGPELPPGIGEDCNPLTQPETETLVVQIGWLWARFNDFFDCQLMVMLGMMYDVMLDSYQLMGWLGRYFISVTHIWSDWFTTDLVYWLGGHFANMANGRITTINVEGGNEQCNNLFCLIDNIGDNFTDLFDDLAGIIRDALEQVVGPIVGTITNAINASVGVIANIINTVIEVLGNLFNTLIDVIGNFLSTLIGVLGNLFNTAISVIGNFFNTLIDLVAQLIYMVFDFVLDLFLTIITVALQILTIVVSAFFQLLDFFATIISAWNTATPTAIPGVPECQIDPQSNPFCVGLWVMEHTVFSGRGALIIPLVIGFFSILLLLWGIKEIKKTITEAGQSV